MPGAGGHDRSPPRPEGRFGRGCLAGRRALSSLDRWAYGRRRRPAGVRRSSALRMIRCREFARGLQDSHGGIDGPPPHSPERWSANISGHATSENRCVCGGFGPSRGLRISPGAGILTCSARPSHPNRVLHVELPAGVGEGWTSNAAERARWPFHPRGQVRTSPGARHRNRHRRWGISRRSGTVSL